MEIEISKNMKNKKCGLRASISTSRNDSKCQSANNKSALRIYKKRKKYPK